jgi:hypothetical protein
LGQDLLDPLQAADMKSALVWRKGARDRRPALVIVEIEELLAGQLVMVVLTLRPPIELTANPVHTVVNLARYFKKSDAVAGAEQALSGRGWLPEMLRVSARVSEDSSRQAPDGGGDGASRGRSRRLPWQSQ